MNKRRLPLHSELNAGVRMTLAITPELVEQHQLTPAEYAKIVDILGREPSYTELGIFSVMWSEHCSYKSSRVHLKKLPTRGSLVVQGPGENAGIIDIGAGYVIAFKIESHNHPSFISNTTGRRHNTATYCWPSPQPPPTTRRAAVNERATPAMPSSMPAAIGGGTLSAIAEDGSCRGSRCRPTPFLSQTRPATP